MSFTKIMKHEQSGLLFGLLIIIAVLCVAPEITGMSALAQSTMPSHCTASQPCVDICGDHVCAPGELAQIKAKAAQAPVTNATVSSTSAVTIPSTGIDVGGVVSYMDVASDGTAVVVRTGHPLSGQPLAIGLAFKDANENFVQHQNYAITITQDKTIVFSNPAGHTHSGTDSINTIALLSNDPVNISVTLNGVGLPTADPSTWTGVKGEVLVFSQVSDIKTPAPAAPVENMTNSTTSTQIGNATVPEFGPIVGMIIVISVIGSIALSRRFSLV
jgi:hypothetical protein